MIKNTMPLDIIEDLKHALDVSTIIAITDTDGVITYVNDAFCQISKYSSEELLGENHRIIKSGFHSEAFYQDMWCTINAGQVWHGEVKNKAKDNSFYWVDTTIVPILDTTDKPIQFISIRHDITQKKNTETELSQLNIEMKIQTQLRTELLHQINVALSSEINARNRTEKKLLQEKNDAEKISRLKRNALKQINWALSDQVNASKQTEKKLTQEKNDAEDANNLKSKAVAQINLALSDQVNTSKQVEKTLIQEKNDAQDANNLKSKAMAFVSHDFKSPLIGLERSLKLIMEEGRDTLTDNHHLLLQLSLEAVLQLRAMVVDILDKARLDQGQFNPTIETVEIHTFLNQLKPEFVALSINANVELDLHVDRTLDTLQADPVHLRLILINLINNAAKYSKPNGKIFVRAYPSKTGRWLVLEVEDDGIGIAKEKMKHLFTEFYRTALHPEIEGSGLGLSFVKKLVKQHGGKVHAMSEFNQGSLFRVHLPLPKTMTPQLYREVPDHVRASLFRNGKSASLRNNQNAYPTRLATENKTLPALKDSLASL